MAFRKIAFRRQIASRDWEIRLSHIRSQFLAFPRIQTLHSGFRFHNKNIVAPETPGRAALSRREEKGLNPWPPPLPFTEIAAEAEVTGFLSTKTDRHPGRPSRSFRISASGRARLRTLIRISRSYDARGSCRQGFTLKRVAEHRTSGLNKTHSI